MTLAQMTAGAQWCACSHTSGTDDVTFYPMQSGGSSGCGGSVAGIRSCGVQGQSDVCCITA
jgi:hypothetical protein